jgi:hypothetical protein
MVFLDIGATSYDPEACLGAQRELASSVIISGVSFLNQPAF